MNPVQVQQLMEIARRLDAAVHGERAAIYEAGALAMAARKAKAVPFGGRIDPHKYVNDTVLPAYLPRRGSNLVVYTPTVDVAPLTLVEAAKLLRPRLGHLWSPKTYGWLMERFPDGVPQEQLEAIEAELKRPVEVGRRSVVSVDVGEGAGAMMGGLVGAAVRV